MAYALQALVSHSASRGHTVVNYVLVTSVEGNLRISAKMAFAVNLYCRLVSGGIFLRSFVLLFRSFAAVRAFTRRRQSPPYEGVSAVFTSLEIFLRRG